MSYIDHINNRTKIKQDLARLLGREFSDLSNVTIGELLNDVQVCGLEYEGSVMRGEVINGHQFLYFNKHES